MSVFIYYIFNGVKRLFLVQSLKWCNSYDSIVTTMWIWFLLCFYAIFLIMLKLFAKLYLNTRIVDELCKCIEEGDTVRCVKLLDEYDPNYINVYNRNGYTPFLVACANGQTQIIKLMLKKGANVKLKSKQFESAFYLTTFYYIKNPHIKNATCIRELYYAGANIDEPNAKGLTPLQMAAMFGHTPLVRWLLLKNASAVTAPDPYMLAISQGHQETAKIIHAHTHGLAIEFKIK
ncbi:unnamed protein product [Callosobruchus maculatus]|uniref:Uncharacterized protein n=1 Tax=Callosobruchus maculatus TaxID=64391 RepID=A0A653CLJ7_CALMS|nr:unnamed protein product [Callosobruchus maculatus]